MIFFKGILIAAFLTLFSIGLSAQIGNGLRFPSLGEARLGHLKTFKIPSLKDYQNFTNQYTKHLAILDRRSEKAYRKSFLKFIKIEDELLYTLCDSNEFRANALMRSASASFGKMEADRIRDDEKPGLKSAGLEKAVRTGAKLIPELKTDALSTSLNKRKANQHRFGSEQYASYMQKRVRLYKQTFEQGTKRQKKLLRKLRKRALLWQSFKAQDDELISKFADNHLNIMRSVKATDSYKSAMTGATGYSGTQLDPGAGQPAYSREALLGKLQEKLEADGLLSSRQIEEAKGIGDLFKGVRQARKAAKDSLNNIADPASAQKLKQKKASAGRSKEKPVKINSKSAKRFWDRLYGGVNFDWENSTGYYPDGLGITFTGGYHISDDSGLNIEAETLLNGSKMGFSEDLRFKSTLVSNYSLGANIDYRLWKIFFAGMGAELIVNTIETPALQFYDALGHTDYTWGLPLTAKAILPIGGSKSTQVQFSYDLNSKHNIKPKFDFSVGFLIGR